MAERNYESLCPCADSCCEKLDTERLVATQILKRSSSDRYSLPFIILLYLLTGLGLILHDHKVFAGKQYASVPALSPIITSHRISRRT